MDQKPTAPSTYTVQDPFTDAVLIGFELPPRSRRAVKAAAAQGITVDQLLRDVVDARFKEWHRIVQRVGLEGPALCMRPRRRTAMSNKQPWWTGFGLPADLTEAPGIKLGGPDDDTEPPVWRERRVRLEGEAVRPVDLSDSRVVWVDADDPHSDDEIREALEAE